MIARQFGCDSGDMYGRHALVNPGGDNVQRDVMHILYPKSYAMNPLRITENYVGRHRPEIRDRIAVLDRWDAIVAGTAR